MRIHWHVRNKAVVLVSDRLCLRSRCFHYPPPPWARGGTLGHVIINNRPGSLIAKLISFSTAPKPFVWFLFSRSALIIYHFPSFFPRQVQDGRVGGRGWVPHIWQPTSRLSPQPTSLLRLLLCARLGPVRTAPPAKLPTISILYNNPVFVVVPFVSHLALPSLGWGRVHLLTGTRREGWSRCERTHAHAHAPAWYSNLPPHTSQIHSAWQWIHWASTQLQAPSPDMRHPATVLLFAPTAFTSLAINCTYWHAITN